MNLKRLVFSSALLAGVVFGSVCNTNASPVTYTNYQLYAYCDNNYTNTHSKQTTTQSIRNTVTSFTSTDKANFWSVGVVNGTAVRISSVHSQIVGSTCDLSFDQGYYIPKFGIVQMGMENGYNVNYSALVSGTVDFR